MRDTRKLLLLGVQKTLYTLAVIASILLVVDVVAPWLTTQLLPSFKTFLKGLSGVEAQIIVYLIMQALTVAGLLLFVRFFNAKLTDIGIGRLRHWYILLLTPLVWMLYMMLSLGLSFLMPLIFHGFNGTEKQE